MSPGVPAVLMRGGTSKGVFLHARHVPPAGPRRDALVLDLMGSPDPMQIDGLGGTYSSTSKVMIVEPGPDSTVLYWFGQVGVDTATVDWSGNCGNLTTAVAAFAVDEGLVPAVAPVTFVRLLNGNTGVRIVAEVPVENGRVQTRGTQRVAGVPRPGAPIATHYQYPGGSVTGRLLPTGRVTDALDLPDGPLTVSIVDVASAFVFVQAADLGVVPGTRTVAELNGDRPLLERIEQVRGEAARLIGTVERAEEAARLSPVVPRITLVAPAQDLALGRSRGDRRLDGRRASRPADDGGAVSRGRGPHPGHGRPGRTRGWPAPAFAWPIPWARSRWCRTSMSGRPESRWSSRSGWFALPAVL